MEANKKGNANRDVRDKLSKAYVAKLDFDVPPSFQQQELQNEVQSIVRNRRANGESEEDVEKNKDQITAEANAKAIDKLRWFFHKKIVELEKIEVSREEVLDVVAMQAQQMGKDPQAYIKELAENNQIPTSKID